MNEVIPFYGAEQPELFEIERRCMDGEGKLIRYLDDRLPPGRVLDVGAGTGYTADKLARSDRTVVACEPNGKMIRPDVSVPWLRGSARHLPLSDASLEAAYATWAFFFPQWIDDVQVGVDELLRVVRPGGRILIADNAGGDAFCALFEKDLASDASWWKDRGFDRTVVESAYVFDSIEEAKRLFDFYWSHNGRPEGSELTLRIGFDIAVYEKVV